MLRITETQLYYYCKNVGNFRNGVLSELLLTALNNDFTVFSIPSKMKNKTVKKYFKSIGKEKKRVINTYIPTQMGYDFLVEMKYYFENKINQSFNK